MIYKDKENPIANEWKKLYSEQTKEVKEKLDALDKMKLKDYQLCLVRTFGGILYCLITGFSVYVYLSYTICNFQKPEKNVRCVCKYIFFIWSPDEMNICQG